MDLYLYHLYLQYLNILHLHEPCFRLLSLYIRMFIYVTSSLYFALFPLDIAPRFRRAPGQLLCVSGPKHSQKIRILDVLGYIVSNILAVKRIVSGLVMNCINETAS